MAKRAFRRTDRADCTTLPRVPAALSLFVLIALAACFAASISSAQSQSLTISDRGSSKSYSARELLALPDTRAITLPDPVYRRSMTYQALAVADLLKGMAVGPDDYIQVTASDNFSVGIPARLLLERAPDQPRAFLAIENPGAPWPVIPGKQTSAGHFYVVWQLAGAAKISTEYWAYAAVALTVTDSPYKRWPGLAVGNEVPPTDPARRGLDRFVAVCMACHRFNGAGEATLGPDLADPMNPVDYFQLPALKKYLHNPKSVRSWPDQKMQSAEAMGLSDDDIDSIIAWLTYKARNPR
jgi:mono/diheme cytochrome c family protein